MFNSSIKRLLGISKVNKDNKEQKQNKKENNRKNENPKVFDEGSDFFTDISTENFDAETFILDFVKNLKKQELSEKATKKVDEFIAKFDMQTFELKNGKNLSKEDLTVILYTITEKWGVKPL